MLLKHSIVDTNDFSRLILAISPQTVLKLLQVTSSPAN